MITKSVAGLVKSVTTFSLEMAIFISKANTKWCLREGLELNYFGECLRRYYRTRSE